jgi:uncharacterized membrane protein
MIIPGATDQQALFLQEMAHRVTPSADLFLFSILSVLVLGAAILLDVPVLFVLAALLSPFLGPVLGMGLASISGTPRFFFQSLGGIVLACLIYFAGGMGAGWVASILWKDLPVVPSQVFNFAVFSWPDLVVLSAGAVISAFLLAQDGKQKPLVSSVALAYEILLPVGAAGFGLSSGLPGLFPNALIIFATHLLLAVLLITMMLAVQGLRPRDRWSFTSATIVIMSVLVIAVGLNNMGPLPVRNRPTPLVVTLAKVQNTLTPQPTRIRATAAVSLAVTATLPLATLPGPDQETPTNTLVPSLTPTLTATIAPTPVYAKVSAGEGTGAFVRESPDYNSKVLKTLLNDSLVEILPETIEKNGQIWIKVRLPDDTVGWIVRYLVITTTPVR